VSVALGIVAIGVFVVVALLVLVVANRGKSLGVSRERGADMIRTVYIYVVLVATLMMTIGGSVASFMAIADIVAPPEYYQSFEEYQRMPKAPDGSQQNLTADQVKQNYDLMVKQEKQRVQQRAVNSLIKSFGWIVIPFPVFLYYQRKLKERPVSDV